MFDDLKNLYEVRKTVRFELLPEYIGSNKKPSGNDAENRLQLIFENLEGLKNLYTQFVNNFGKLLINEHEKIISEEDDLQGNKIILPPEILEQFNSKNGYENNKQGIIKNYLGEYEVSSLLQFKYQGIQKVFKNDWFENKKEILFQKEKDGTFKKDDTGRYKKKDKNYLTLTDLGNDNFIKIFFETWIKNNQEIYIKISSFQYTQNDLSRISDIGFEVQKLNSRKYLGKLYTLFEGGYLAHKNDTKILEKLKKDLQEIKDIITVLLSLTKPSQSFGLPIEHISLNYYTRNKTPKEYDVLIEEKRKLLQKPFVGSLGKLYGIDPNQSIENLYREMKTFKAREKSAFMQLLQQKVSYEYISKPFEYIDFEGKEYTDYQLKLFANIKEGKDRNTKQTISKQQVYKNILLLTTRIEKENDRNKKTQLKIQRGNHFIGKWFSFPDYQKFCDGYEEQTGGRKHKIAGYKQVAMEYGKRKAEVLMLEREKILAVRERGWGFISKNDNNEYFLNTVPAEKTESMYHILKDKKVEVLGGNLSYFLLSSITLRALDKLCFSKDSSFSKNIKTRICPKFLNEIIYDNGTVGKMIKPKSQLEEEKLLIKFYNEVLDVQNTLGIVYRDENSQNILKNSKNEEEFEINLKLECYVLQEHKTSQEKILKLLKEHEGNSYKITSWDLRAKRNSPEEHTKWWLDFWGMKNDERKFPLRVNPEMTISFIELDRQFIKQNPNKTNNRRTRERYLLQTTFSHHADCPYIDAAFIGEERNKSIEQFNTKFGKKYDYFYGLDKGTDELITLGVYKKGPDGNIENVHISEKLDIYTIMVDGLNTTKKVINKDSSEKTHTLHKNPSLFLDQIEDSSIFQKKNIYSCLGNLTSAKLIAGKIFLNGDVNTIQKLYEVNAKRFIYIMIKEKGTTEDTIIFDEKEQVFRFSGKGIYYYNENVKYCVSIADIEKTLNKYIKDIKNFDPGKDEAEDISISRINHIKNAICANIVGVIMKLQEFFPGYIIFENLKVSTSNSDLEKQNTFLGNLINEKIYNKLQLLNEIPPILKKFREDLDDKSFTQHGKVLYINKQFTSSACPICNNTLTKTDEQGNTIEKKGVEIHQLYGHFTESENCMHHINEKGDQNYQNGKWGSGTKDGKPCDYHIGSNEDDHKTFAFIESGNDLATYNIAKKAKEYLESLSEQSSR